MTTILDKVMWVGRVTTFCTGLVVILAVVLGVGTTALAAAPGDPFELGKLNTINKITRLVGGASGALLRVENEGGGQALDLKVEEGQPPMTVDSNTQVNGLNADQLDGQSAGHFLGVDETADNAGAVDGKSADEFVSEDNIYQDFELETGSGGGAQVTVFADCDSGDRVLGGGGSALSNGDVLIASDPFGESWRVVAVDNFSGSTATAEVICADFPPLR